MDEDKKPEQEVDVTKFVERRDAFVKEYGELVSKHQVDFATYPQWVPDGQGAFKTIMQNIPVDISNQPKKSPFVAS